MAGHQRTADTPACGGRADTPAGGGQASAILRMGIHAHARREPQRGGREDVSTSRPICQQKITIFQARYVFFTSGRLFLTRAISILFFRTL